VHRRRHPVRPTVINVPDTVGYSHPVEYGELIRRRIENILDSDKVIWSAHRHNDPIGLAAPTRGPVS